MLAALLAHKRLKDYPFPFGIEDYHRPQHGFNFKEGSHFLEVIIAFDGNYEFLTMNE